jgi:L,D-transpeptidase ErfK/SrfK
MNKRILLILVCFVISGFFASSKASETYSYDKDAPVIGSLKTHTVKGKDSLIEIARKYDIGYNEITDANPKLDAFVPGDGKSAVIPAMWILPELTAYDGVVINLSEMRLYFFSKKSTGTVNTFPIGIGSEGKETPVGKFTIIEKIVKPSWRVPESIRKEKPELPAVVPPGPDNPLGSHALRLSLGSVLIHGTNRPYAVGRKASHGCIRMYPEDIPKLFQMVPKGAKVTIIRQPIKIGISDDRVYVEVHRDTELHINYFNEAVRLLIKRDLYRKVDKDKMLVALREKKGFPVDISK